jgi:flagellar hook-associated protein 2
MADSSTLFTGASRYASDFQSLIDRAVRIASLPLTQLQSARSTLQAQSSALSALEDAFQSLQTALSSLESATGVSGYSTAVSNGAVLSAAVSTGAMTGVWTVEVTSLGAWTSTLSKDGLTTVTDPSTQNISAASSFTLTVDGTPTVITPAAGTLAALVEAINEADLEVEASVVNLGSGSSPDYRLAIRSTKLAAVSIQLNDGTQDLMETLATGGPAAYKVNGMASAIQSDSRTVTLAPGLTITLLSVSETGVATTVTVSRSATAFSNALSSLVTAYNAAVDALDAHRGQKGGALAGQSIVFTLTDALRQLTRYEAGSGAIRSLTDLGLSFDDKGKLSLDATAFQDAVGDNASALLDFLGASAGSGFLQWASGVLDGLLDSTDGALSLSLGTLRDQLSAQDDRIEAEQDRVEQIRQNLVAQMAAADALIASLEQQARYITGLFESMRIAARMYSQ